MTFSIVARQGDAYGVAVASKFLAVGALVPEAGPHGAVATQAWGRVAYRRELLDALADGQSPEAALERCTAADAGAATRQLGVVGAEGAATFTGAEAPDWAGGRSGEADDLAWAIQGNILAGEQVVEQMERTWLERGDLPFEARLVAALRAGDEAGGDRRGRQSAAVVAHQPGRGYDETGVLADLRVDDHPDPVAELTRLLDLHELYFGLPGEPIPLTGPLAEEVRRRLAEQGRTHQDLRAALTDWAGEVNLEGRLLPDGIDARVLQMLRERPGG